MIMRKSFVVVVVMFYFYKDKNSVAMIRKNSGDISPMKRES